MCGGGGRHPKERKKRRGGGEEGGEGGGEGGGGVGGGGGGGGGWRTICTNNEGKKKNIFHTTISYRHLKGECNQINIHYYMALIVVQITSGGSRNMKQRLKIVPVKLVDE